VNVHNDRCLWTGRFDREMEDLFALQEELANSIVSALELRISGDSESRRLQRYAANVEAYHVYLRGRFHWNRASPESLHKAIRHYREAISMDSHYALAFAGLADCYLVLGMFGLLQPREAWSQAMDAAKEALRLDPTIAEAHAALGAAIAFLDLAWTAAASEIQQALRLNPGYAHARYWLAMAIYCPQQRFEEAFAELKEALRSDPLSLLVMTATAWAHYLARDYAEAIAAARRVLDLDGDHWEALLALAASSRELGLTDESRAALIGAEKEAPKAPMAIAMMGHGLALLGRRDEALQYVRRLQDLEKEVYVSPTYRAWIFTALREFDAAFEWIERAYDERDFFLRIIGVSKALEPLHADPRFRDVLRRIHLEFNSTITAIAADPSL
jgi:serine/threonine-protein kinase